MQQTAKGTLADASGTWREGDESSVVIWSVSVKNSLVAEAMDPSGPYIDMEVDGTMWRFKRGAWPSFEAFLFRGGEAALIQGGLAWADEDIRPFLSRLQLREGPSSDTP